jgi:hypothetical protein
MSPNSPEIDISENRLRNRGRVLDILLSVRCTRQNIIWATDSYVSLGRGYDPKRQMRIEHITGGNGTLIQPRAAKSRQEHKAEVFTPLRIVKDMNASIDLASTNYPITTDNWLEYIQELRLEITCGEAPFIAGRYNPTSNTGLIIKPDNRVGFLDRKMQAVKKFTANKADWLSAAETALKACYGYEWQGDNLLIARENILLTMDDFYRDKFDVKKGLKTEQLEHFAEIISWNVWQMDGLKYVKPMSCKQTSRSAQEKPKNQLQLLPAEKPDKIKVECEGCRTNDPFKHTGTYPKIMDWQLGKPTLFVSLLQSREVL